MGKKVKAEKKVVKKEKKQLFEEDEMEEPKLSKAVDSIAVAQKKANDLKIKKQIKQMNAQVLEKVDLKQVISAAKALKAFAKKQSEVQAESTLLVDEDQTIHVSFTMTRVPTNPSPKP